MDVSRITRGKIQLRTQRLKLASVIEQALETCRPIADREHQTIEVSFNDDSIEVEADPVRLAQVFNNLRHNACKFTPNGGHITLHTKREGREVVVSIRDNGIGIPADKLESIFEMFLQVDETMERSRGGLGIGLTLAQRLVVMHGGSIEAKSAGVGHGSEFIVHLPIAAPLAASSNSSNTSPANLGFKIGTCKRILVVDDNIDAALTLQSLFAAAGHIVQVAHDGLQAIQMAELFRPDAVLLDIGLPRMNGYDACRRIRKSPWGADVKIAALTGWGQEEDRRKSSEAGFDIHLVKPVEAETVFHWLESTGPSGRPRSCAA
jgi:CheY-like chemotaxis protein/two-component sensor histidine kinase